MSSTLGVPGRRKRQRRDATRAPTQRPEWHGGGRNPSPKKTSHSGGYRGKSRGIGGSAPKLRRRVATSLHDTSILLELRRWHIAESGVEPFLVVDAFEELTHACASLAEIPIFAAIYLLVFEGLHERLTGSVVV